MNIKDFFNHKVDTSVFAFRSGVFETPEEEKKDEVSKEERRLTNAQSRRMYAALLILIGIYVLFRNIYYPDPLGIIFGFTVVVLGYLLFNYLQKRIRTLQVQITYEKAPSWYRLVSIGSIMLAYVPLYLINTFVDKEIGMGVLFMIPYVIGLTACSILFFWLLFVVEKKKYKTQLLLLARFSFLCLLFGMYLFLIFSL